MKADPHDAGPSMLILQRLVLFVTFLVLAGFGYDGVASTKNPTLDRVLKTKQLRIGVTGTQPPLNAVSRQGQLIGYEIELARGIAGAMGVEPKFVTIPFGELLDALRSERVDVVMSGMSITAERSRSVSFIGPYLMSGKAILTKSPELARATTSAALNRSNYKLAALENSTSQTFVELVAPSAKLVVVKNYEEGINRVIESKVDGLVADMPVGLLAVLRHPAENLLTSSQPLSIEPLGIAVKRGDPAFSELVSNYLEAYRAMGILARLRKKYLEDDGWLVSLPLPAAGGRPEF